MKKYLFLLGIIVSFALLTVACEAGGSEGTAQAFLKAVQNQDFKQAANYTTEDTKEMLNLMESVMTPLSDEQKAEAEAQKALALQISKVEESAIVTYTLGDQEPQTLDLVKVNGVWKVRVGVVNSPAMVAESFLAAIKKMDFPAAAEYATDESKNMLLMMESFMGQLDEEQKAEAAKQAESPFTIGKVEIEGDKARVFYTMGSNAEQSLDLLKQGGRWKVVFNKGA